MKKKIFNSSKIKVFSLLCIILFLMSSLSVYAKNYASKYAWKDDAGNIILSTEDHKKTSNVSYMTIGWTITRCKLGTQEPIEDQYVTIRYDGSLQDVPIGNGYTTSAFMITEDRLLSKIGSADVGWLADVQSGETCYLKFDAIMITVNGSYSEEDKYSGFMISENNQDYFGWPNNPLPGVYDKYTKDDLKYKTYGWYDPEKIDTHFDIYLLYNGEEEEIIMPESDEFIATTGKLEPKYYTWNTSDEFDLSKGIPSGENITNGYGTDRWYGQYSIGKHDMSKGYLIDYILSYELYEKTKDAEYGYKVDTDGNGVNDSDWGETSPEVWEWVAYTQVITREVTKKASYYYCMNATFYEMQKAEVHNSTYPGDLIRYYNPWPELMVDCIFDDVHNPEEVEDWLQTEEDELKHVTFSPNKNPGGIDYLQENVMLGHTTMDNVNAVIDQIDSDLYDNVAKNGYDPIGSVKSKNDQIIIDNVTYMDATEVTDTWNTEDVLIEWVPLPSGDDPVYGFKEDTKTVTIPETVANGSYATDIEVTYKKRILNNGYTMVHSAFGETIYEHIKEGYEVNEPVWVLTPVVSPVTIPDGEGETQLVAPNITEGTEADRTGRMPDGKAIYDLLLDGTYTSRFDPAMHEDWQGYGEGLFEKYVKAKYIKFPFDVKLKDTFYYADEEDGCTEWIKVYDKDSSDNIEVNNEVEFYIPPWAEESYYCEIQYKVEAYNVEDENGDDHSEDKHPTANDENRWEENYENYVATYVVPVELSGIIYDFEVTGCTNYADYNTEIDENGNLESGSISFALYKNEKKQGNLNRLGTSSVRYTLDGMITNNWEEVNTLPLAMGTSSEQKYEGYLKLGETFTFSVQTIANLWDEDDSIQITPTFRYYSAKGKEYEDVHVYYWEDGRPVRMGSSVDLQEMQNKDNLSYTKFSYWGSNAEGSWCDGLQWRNLKPNIAAGIKSNSPDSYLGDYHDEDLIYTIQRDNQLTAEDYESLDIQDKTKLFSKMLGVENSSYCMGYINLNSKQRLLTGNYEELAVNIDDDKGSLTVDRFHVDEETADKMKYSMQTWYGNYHIPEDIMVCPGDTFENLGATDTDNDGVIDLWDYLVCFQGKEDDAGNYVNGVDRGAYYWLTNDYPYGYLVLNFDIMTIRDGKPHLKYYGSEGALDMWERQGGQDTAPMGDPVIEDVTEGADPKDQYPVIEIPIISGDVALINTGIKAYNIKVQDLF